MHRSRAASSVVTTIVTLAATAVLALAIACGGGSERGGLSTDIPTVFSPILPGGARIPSCGANTALMSVSPVALTDVVGWVPLGNLGPPAHLFPTDHQYLYVNRPATGGAGATFNTVALNAPANIIITGAHRTRYSFSDIYDYTLDFALCDEVRGTFGHVTTLTSDLLNELGAFDQQCYSYDLGLNNGTTFSGCYTKSAGIVRSVSALIGTVGGQTSLAVDFYLHDTRRAPLVYANAARWPANTPQAYTVAASDYFIEPVRRIILAHIGNYNGTMLRAAEPRGGQIAYDIPGTMRGAWINAAMTTVPEAAHLAVVSDPIDPAIQSLSIGTSQPDFPTGLYQYLPLSSGYVNRDPTEITADGHIYCFEFGQGRGVVLARMETASSLKIEGRTGFVSCAEQQPFEFTGRTFVYVR